MIRRALIILSLVPLLLSCNRAEKLRGEIEAELATNKGEFALAFRDHSGSNEILINAKERFHAASTMKTPVMIEVYRQSKEGLFGLNDSILVRNEFKSIVDSSAYSLAPADDSDNEMYGMIGNRRPVSEVMYHMITESSNLATNMLIERVGAEKVTATMREMGAMDIQVLRGVEDQKAFDKGMINTVTAYDLMIIMEKIAKGEAVDSKSSGEMMEILFDQKHNEIIPAQLPKNVRVAHKTGWLKGVHHDSAIVVLPDGRWYVLVLLSRKLEDEKAAVESMARVSRMIYDFVQ